jgi:hypothetical protein
MSHLEAELGSLSVSSDELEDRHGGRGSPARQRGKRGVRAKATGADSLAPLGRDRERVSAWGRKPPLTGDAHLSDSAGTRPRWAGWTGLGCFGFFFFPRFSNCFSISFSLGFSIQIQTKFQIQTNSNMCNNSKNI